MDVSLESTLNLKETSPFVFRGQHLYTPSVSDGKTFGVYGGNLVAQAMQAALLTINEDKFRFSSVHCCYISPVTSTALLYHVMREKDGKTFCYRSVRATQEGSDKTAFNAFVTFQLKGGDSVDAFSHCSHPMPEVPDPGQCVPYLELKDSIFTRGLFKEKFPIDVRFCSAQPWEHTSARQQYKELPSLEPRCSFWVKSSTNLDPDDDNVHYLALAYSSDFCTPSIVTRKHPNVDIEVAASLSHSIMFHKPTNFNSWNLLDVECDSSIGLKCSNMARFYTDDGVLVATVMQEAFIRPKV